MNRRNGFVVAFLLIQLLLPLRGLRMDKLETRGNFSWNMYSQRYGCRTNYLAIGADGQVESVEPRDYFNRPSRSAMAYHRDSLPELHRFLCEQLQAEDRAVRLRGSMACKLNRKDREELIDENGDLCTAPNYGVAER